MLACHWSGDALKISQVGWLVNIMANLLRFISWSLILCWLLSLIQLTLTWRMTIILHVSGEMGILRRWLDHNFQTFRTRVFLNSWHVRFVFAFIFRNNLWPFIYNAPFFFHGLIHGLHNSKYLLINSGSSFILRTIALIRLYLIVGCLIIHRSILLRWALNLLDWGFIISLLPSIYFLLYSGCSKLCLYSGHFLLKW